MPDDESTRPHPLDVPCCPVDGLRLTSTVVGWRCPICGVAQLAEAS